MTQIGNMNIRWLATAVVISGAAMAAIGQVPFCFLVLFIGSLLWIKAAHDDKDNPLLALNTTMAVFNLIAYLNN